jgi:hypothetical protein
VVALALPPLLPELHPDRTRPTITVPNTKGVRMFTLRAYDPRWLSGSGRRSCPSEGFRVVGGRRAHSHPGGVTMKAGEGGPTGPARPEDADRPLNR